jgi:uncharacterized protein YbjT (DUF2867 family)
MKVLIAGATSYTGSRLLPILLEKGHELTCVVRDPAVFMAQFPQFTNIQLIAGNLLKENSIGEIPSNIDAAYYLIHSLTDTPGFAALESLSAHNFVELLKTTQCKQLIYLAGIANKDTATRKQVEHVLTNAHCPFTGFHASAIIGPGSIFMDIIQKFSGKGFLITGPSFLHCRCQPIAIQDVLAYLVAVLLNPNAFNKTFEICGPEVMSFKDLLKRYIKKNNLNRRFITMPLFAASLTHYKLSAATGLPLSLAKNLAKSLHREAFCNNDSIQEIAYRKCLSFEEVIT